MHDHSHDHHDHEHSDDCEHCALQPNADPHFIWIDDNGIGRSQVVFFRRSFFLDEEPGEGTVHIFADTRYRLILNGTVLGHGPARFHLGYAEYDSYDLTPYLVDGENVLGVIVHSIGSGTFSSDASIGGLAVWGEVETLEGDVLELDSGDGEWIAVRADAYSSDTTRLSFALGPFEELDANLLPDGWELPGFDTTDWPAAVAIANPGHWGELFPRSIPLLDEREVWPAKEAGIFATVTPETDEQSVVSLRCNVDEPKHWALTTSPLAFVTFVHSPVDQTVDFGLSWGRLWVNGEEQTLFPRADLLWRNDSVITLKAGWNSWLSIDGVSGDAYEYAVQWPKEAGLTVSAGQLQDTVPTFYAGGPWPGADTDELAEALRDARDARSLPEEFGPWQLFEARTEMPSPYAARAWQHVRPVYDADDTEEGDLVLLYDFGTEVLGRPRLEFTAAEGTVIDLLYTERLQDGAARHGMQNTRMGERYIATEGEQQWYPLHPRGMRYLEIIVRGGRGKFELRHLGLTRANFPVRDFGSFQCSDPVLNQIWKVGRDTLFACMEDAYLDCPWRERGLYTGDLLVQYYSNLATFGDHELMMRSLLQLLETQDETGLLSCSSHGLPAGRHPDYSAIAVQAIWHYWARTGDLDFVEAQEDRLRNLLAGLQGIEEPGLNLINTDGREPYVDLSAIDTFGINMASNCLHQRAFSDGAQLLQLLNDDAGAMQYEAHADEVAAAIREAFWDAGRGVFLDRRPADVDNAEPSTLGNVYALIYEIASDEQSDQAIDFITESMADIRRIEHPDATADFNLTTYSSFYALGLLYQYGKDDEAESYMRENYGALLEQGAVTWWEYFLSHWSLCHAWSSAPTHYLSTQVLGIRYATPGQPDDITIDPLPGSVQWASGTYPHPRGPIYVEWERRGGQLILDYDAPDGVNIILPQDVDE